MPRVLLVRHADSVPPTAGGPGDFERPLSPLGMRQAAELTGVLVAERPTRILSSPYLRARQTVAPTAAALSIPVEERDDLREWDSGLAPTPTWRERYRCAWEHDTERYGDGESLVQLQERAVTALLSAASGPSAETIVIASHGTWIARLLRGLGRSIDADFWFEMPMPAVYQVSLQRDRVDQLTGPGLVHE